MNDPMDACLPPFFEVKPRNRTMQHYSRVTDKLFNLQQNTKNTFKPIKANQNISKSINTHQNLSKHIKNHQNALIDNKIFKTKKNKKNETR